MIRDEGALAELEQRTYDDPAVKLAVIDMVRAAGVFVTPNGSGDTTAIDARARAAYDKLASLCELQPQT